METRDLSASAAGRSASRTVRGLVALAACGLLLGVVACTTSEGSDSGSDGGASTTSSSVPTTEAGTAAKGDPVKVGFVNTGTGATAIPEILDGAELAVTQVNDHGNGINGRPIELVTCSADGTPESSAACANKLVSAGVVAVIEGSDLGSDAKVPILRDAGIATIGTSTLGTSQSLNPDAFFFSPPATTYPAAEVDLAAQIGAKNLTLLVPDVPQVPIVTDIGNKQAGITGIEFQVVTFDPAAPDFDAALAAIMSNGSDAIATIATDDWCTGMIRSARSAGFTGDLIMGTCSRYVDDLGLDQTTGLYGLSSVWSPRSRASAPEEGQQAIDQYVAAMDEAGKSDAVVGQTYIGWVAIEQSAGVLRTVDGDLTAESVMAAMRTLKDAPNPLGQPITCDPRPYPGFSGCTTGWLMLRQEADGTAKPVSDGFQAPKT